MILAARRASASEAISSRALFDFEEENEVFEQGDDRAYMALQLERLDVPAKPGVAFSLVKKLLTFNQNGNAEALAQPVEVVILSRNDPVSGMRVFRSAQAYDLPIVRGSFTRGQSPWRYLKPLHANLFLSTHLSDVRAALDAGVPAAQVYPHSAHASEAHPTEVRIAFDGDAVLFSDEAERVYQAQGLDAFQRHETTHAQHPLAPGPFKPLLSALQRLQQSSTPETDTSGQLIQQLLKDKGHHIAAYHLVKDEPAQIKARIAIDKITVNSKTTSAREKTEQLSQGPAPQLS